MAIEYDIGGGERTATSRPCWRSGALRLLLAAATLAESEGSEPTIYKESYKCEYNYETRGQHAPMVESIIILLLCAVVVLQWRLMASCQREEATKTKMSGMAATLDLEARSKASQSQVTYLRDRAQPRFQPLNENLQG